MKAEHITHMGDDLLVVNAARVSFDKQHDEFTYRKDVAKGSDEGLLHYLANHNHWTPFSHPRETFVFPARYFPKNMSENQRAGIVVKASNGQLKMRHSLWGWASILDLCTPDLSTSIARELSILYPESCKALGIAYTDPVDRDEQYKHIPNPHFKSDNPCRRVCLETDPDFIDITMREKVPIFIARQRFKHMVGFTYNEVSRRYVDDSPTFYTPDTWRSRPEGSVKQGSGTGEITEILNECVDLKLTVDKYNEYALGLYNDMLASNVAPEQARMVLPQSMYTSYYVTGSLAAWARAYKQRIDPHAQQEIQELAKQWGEIIEPLFPESWAALVNSK